MEGAMRTLPRSGRSSGTGRLSRGPLFGCNCGLSSGSRPLPPRHQESADPQEMAFFLRKHWTLYSVSPLYKFSNAKLKAYARMLSVHIAAESHVGAAVDADSGLGVTVAMSNVPELRGSERDPAAVLIQLSFKSTVSPGTSEEKLIWSGWFCCVVGDDLLASLPQDFTCLPLFLVNGAERYTAMIGGWFQKTFDCCFRRLAISPLSLTWMVAMWSGCKVDKNTAAIELFFSVPHLLYPLDISYAIHPEDAKALWDTVQKTPGEITQEEVDIFMECLYSHFHRHFKIHLSATKLVKVSTAVASAHCDGIVKFLQSQYLVGTLMLLTELAISQIQ